MLRHVARGPFRTSRATIPAFSIRSRILCSIPFALTLYTLLSSLFSFHLPPTPIGESNSPTLLLHSAIKCSLNWLTIKSKRSYNLACFFYKLINSGEPKLLRDLFIDESPDIRRSDRLATKYNNNSFTVTAIRLWRDLPADIINALSLETFKIKAFEFLKHLELEKQTC
ncbi:Protein of unknown function [Cotesia congregata]|uniref:Uncharacterized protein n=1 Tax=Cotesia congregata TaxID=51543 RepID=A0A8J2MWL1_COTCN|nr:Protein of unknown function [Cotesia congregata]